MTAVFPLLPFLLGCTHADQVWLFEVPFADEPDCATEITHNFSDAYIPDTPPGEWNETEQSEQSATLYFAHISQANADNAVLVIAGEVWPGTSTGKGEWEFNWVGVEDTRSSREHDAGYRYTEQAYLEAVETITMTIEGSTASGSWDQTSITDYTWTETDEWEFEVGFTVGDIPSATYLVYDTEEADDIPQANLADGRDCTDSTCQLRVKDTCAESRDFEATMTGFDTEEAYDQLEGATQPHGT